MSRNWKPAQILMLMVLSALPLFASRRGSEARLSLQLERSEAFTGEPYGARITPLANGFVYFYSLDSQGYVTLLYPVLVEDGRGQVAAGDTLVLRPLYAGSQGGLEQLVAVHTREYRPIRTSRQHFLAPDPQDLTDVNARLTRTDRELDNYTTAVLSVMETGVTELAQVEEVEEADESCAGITVHHHVYDYWCPYCDCWHPACTHDHCWCSWEVVHHYHGYYHYHHCFLWDGWHPWWRPPVVYIYLQGGSPWDYDTRPWRTRRVWAERRHYSDRWRSLETPRISDREHWVQAPRRESSDKPDFINLRRKLEEADPKPTPRQPSTLSTDPDRLAPGQESASPRSVLSTGDSREERYLPVPAEPQAKPAPSKASKGKGRKSKGSGSSGKPESKPDSKPEAKPEAKPDKPGPGKTPEKAPDKKPESRPDKPKPSKPSPGQRS